MDFYQHFRPPYFPVASLFFHITGPYDTPLPLYVPEIIHGNQGEGLFIRYNLEDVIPARPPARRSFPQDMVIGLSYVPPPPEPFPAFFLVTAENNNPQLLVYVPLLLGNGGNGIAYILYVQRGYFQGPVDVPLALPVDHGWEDEDAAPAPAHNNVAIVEILDEENEEEEIEVDEAHPIPMDEDDIN